MRALKLVGIVLGCLVALLVILLVAVRLFVNLVAAGHEQPAGSGK